MLSPNVQVLLALSSLGRAATVQQPILEAVAFSETYLNDDFDAFVQNTLETYHVPGLSLAVIDGDDISTKVRMNWPLSGVC